MSEFDDALSRTGIPPVEIARLTDGWVIGEAVNGGILTALAIDAMRGALAELDGHGDPLVFSAFFLSAAQPGPATVATEILRIGGSQSSAQASIHQLGEHDAPVERLRALATFGSLEAQSEPVWRSSSAPELPDPETCVRAERTGDLALPIRLLDRLDLRIDPATAGWSVGRPSGRGELRAWIRFADGREPDLTALAFFLDALPPVAFDLGALGWAPTIELTGHLRRRPAPGWLRVALSTRNVIGGLLEEDAAIWDSTGALVAQSRQLAGVRMPAAPDADGPQQ